MFVPSTRRTIEVSIAINLLIVLILGFWYFKPETQKSDEEKSNPEAVPLEKPADVPAPLPEVKPLRGEKAQQTVERTLLEQSEAANKRTEEENRQELETQTERLNQVSDEETIDQMTRQFQKWLKTAPRQTQPLDIPPVTAETVTAENFDAETAQFHDVLRQESESGYAYQGVMLDAQGRTLLLDLSPEEGAKLYDLMQKMKKNPLLDKVYRQIIMPILDKELKKVQNPS